MPISEAQLTTWSSLGAVAQSSATYATLKSGLESQGSPYSNRSFQSYLQGSYGNDTNIYADSDVDIVMQLDSVYYYNLDALPDDQKALFNSTLSPVQYDLPQFKTDITNWLRQKYGNDVVPGDKAIFVRGNNGRRDADVLPATQFRRYTRFTALEKNYVEGICFFLPNRTRIENYPKVHSRHATAKHQNTNQWFKPTIRIVKNMRNRMVELNMIPDGLAPSYFLEGLLYNVPNAQFGVSYVNTIVNCINWLTAADRTNFITVSEQHYLLRENSPVTWRAAACTQFLTAMAAFWNR